MPLPALATAADVTGRYPDLADTDAGRLADLLDDASAIVRAFTNRTWVDDAGDLADVPDGVAGVVSGMVGRALQNPSGVTQETTGPFNVSYGSSAADRMYLTKHDKMLLRPPGRAFTITPYEPVDYAGSDLSL